MGFVQLRVLAIAVLCGLASGAASELAAEIPKRAAPEPPTAVIGEAGEAVTAEHHMAVTAHPLASRVARDILREGGSAADAAVAAQAVLGLVEPQSSGLGGGAFLLHFDATTGEVTSWDGRETAPATATPDRFLDEDGDPRPWPEMVPGGLSVGVPGALRMLHAVHARYGALPWEGLFEPAIALARHGFGISPRLAASLAWLGAEAFPPETRAYFFDGDGAPLPLGHVIRNEAYAESLERIAREGPDALHEGKIAAAIVAAVREAWINPGDMRLDDLRNYEAVERPAVCAPYRGFEVCGMGPPSSGGLAVQMTLAMLEPFDLGEAPTPQALHVIGEALNLAFADRDRYVADPDFIAVPEGLLDSDYLRSRSALIDPNRANGTVEPGSPPGAGESGDDATNETPGTSHVSIVDGQGNAVSMTTTIESAFGSRLMAGGFLLNNELTDFSFMPEDAAGRVIANRVEPGKRPRSSMAPTLVMNAEGELRMVVGSPGGARIIPYVVKAIVAHLDWGMDPQQAAELFNFGSRNGPFEIERLPVAESWAGALEALGHEVRAVEMTSGLNIIAVEEGRLAGGTDPRREGAALGD